MERVTNKALVKVFLFKAFPIACVGIALIVALEYLLSSYLDVHVNQLFYFLAGITVCGLAERKYVSPITRELLKKNEQRNGSK